VISVIDNFFHPWQLKLVTSQLKLLPFYNCFDHPQNTASTYPGTKTEELIRVNPLLESFITRKLEKTGVPQVIPSFQLNQFGHLRLESDNEDDFVHTDVGYDWAFLLYISDTNLESGTKMYGTNNTPKDGDDIFIKFKQNRMVVFDSSVPHMAWGNHGKDLNDGRLTINGFCEYT
jgi:hypothetical protein|tara:strand:- start:212 stop:736 length:525 start_codon:yes stop_codon:yes gene_type:complete